MPTAPGRGALADDLHPRAAAAPPPVLAAAGPLLAAAALASAPFVGRAVLVGAMAALLAVAIACGRRGERAARDAALVAALGLATLLLPGNGSWAWPAPAVLLAAAALRPAWRGPDGIVAWLRRGTLSRIDLASIVAVAAASAAALVAWEALRRPDVADLASALPALPTWLLLAGGAGWAALNAFGEEAIFRGALYAGLERAFGSRLALVAQAVPFGLVHFHGFPRGFDGVALALVYGLMLGAIRRRTGGLLAAWLAHTVADVVILTLLVAAR